MSSYTTVAGDDFALIARKIYGDEIQAFTIATANPGAFEPLTAGTVLVIPPDVNAPRSLPANLADTNEVTLTIDGENFFNWSDLRINRAFDTIGTFSFSAPFEPDNPKWRQVFQPFSFKTIQVYSGRDLIFTGQLVSTVPVSEPGRTTLSVSGYSLPGVLQDCTPPAPNSGFQYEFRGLTVVDIAYQLGVPFGVQALGGDGAPGAVFDRVAIEPNRKILNFLASLARERSLVITSDEDGALVFHKENAAPGTSPDEGQTLGKLAAKFNEDTGPVNAVVPNFNPQQFYSHVTAFQPTILGIEGRQYTVTNTKLPTVLRPYNFLANDTQAADVEPATKATSGRMYSNAIEYSLEVRTWRNALGKLWKPGEFISLNWPNAMIYEDFTFFIKRVNFRKTADKEFANMTLTLPGGYAGKIPEVLPWDS